MYCFVVEITVIIPCYNELANLKNGVLDEVRDYLVQVDFDWEVIVVDDASTDGSFEFVSAFADVHDRFTAHQIEHGGKPFAIRRGIELAKMDTILFTDMDQSAPLHEIEKLRGAIEAGTEVVIGSRGIEREGFSFFRQSASTIFREGRRSLLLPDIEDTQCGFKAMRTDIAAELFPKLSIFESGPGTGWSVSAFDVELLCMAQVRGYRIEEIVVDWHDRDASDTKFEGSRMKFLEESIDMARQIARVKRKLFLGEYDD